MRTSEEIYHRVRWDPRFDPARFTLGVSRREGGIKRVALSAFVPGGDIPWHRVMLVEADDEVVWDRMNGVDRFDETQAGRVPAAATRRLRAPSIRALVPHRYDPSAADWRPARDARPEAPPTGPGAQIRVLTWNTLWDRYDPDKIATHLRRPLLLATLRASDADVIALQEVEPPLLAMLAREDWIRAGYTFWTDPATSDVAEDGLALLSRLPILESGRCVLGPYKAALAIVVAGPAPAGPLVLATTHLTSNHTANAATRRAAELAELAATFGGVDADLIVMGDFNDSTTGPQGPAARLGLRDAWTDDTAHGHGHGHGRGHGHGPDDATPTFDPARNPLAAVSSLTGQSGRLDRILLRSPRVGGGVQAVATSLVGDVPDASGLYASDHFGIRADLIGTDIGRGVSNARFTTPPPPPPAPAPAATPTARTALAWIPPQELWPAINDLRERYDPQADRWPPHVNVLFGFVPEHEFDRAIPLLAEAAAQVKPFTARLAGVDTIGHRDAATIWLDPASADPEPWAALHREFQQRFPTCRGREDGYTPHLTLGRSDDPQRIAALCTARLNAGMSAQVGKLALLSRRGDEPMRIRAEIELGGGSGSGVGSGSGQVTWLPDPIPTDHITTDDAESTTQHIIDRISSALGSGIVHVVGSRRMGCALPGADVDLVAVLPDEAEAEADLASIRARLVNALPEATHIRQVVGARVPGLRMTVGALNVDLVIVPTGNVDPAEAVERRAELGGPAAIALSAVSDGDAVLNAAGYGRDQAAFDAFKRLARQVKAWAAARGLDSAPFGSLPGLAWVVLTARTASSGEASLARFFEEWAAWDWKNPVALAGGDAALDVSTSPISILTPTDPVRSCTEQVGEGMRDLLVEEFYRGWETTRESTREPEDEVMRRLCEPPPLHRRHAAWARVTVRAVTETALDDVLGRTRGRMRALIGELEALSPSSDVHAWPQAERDQRDHRLQVDYVIGLGRTPPSRQQLADVAARWGMGLPGVSVTWVEGGGVGSVQSR